MSQYHFIEALMEAYKEGLHKADSTILRAVFHKDATYVNATEGDYLHYSLNQYMDVIDQRTSPEALGETKNGDIISIEPAGEEMAFVKARMRMLGRDYLDYLTLINSSGRWQIISKVFTYVPHDEEV